MSIAWLFTVFMTTKNSLQNISKRLEAAKGGTSFFKRFSKKRPGTEKYKGKYKT